MRIAVCGLWHLGTVTAACLAAAGHDVVAFDENVDDLALGKLPVSEPGLEELTRRGIAEGKLCFLSTDRYGYVFERAPPELVWICWDTPVDDNDVADVESVREKIRQLFPYLPDGCTVAISSQLPVGSTTAIENEFRTLRGPDTGVGFAYVPENLRLGDAVKRFSKPGFVIFGAHNDRDFDRLTWLWGPSETKILRMSPESAEMCKWGPSETKILRMSPESAEMCKHAINAFLATQIALTNEIAVICEKVSADARDVEAALRSDPRIGPKAYVKAGAAFAGGTLARDLRYLRDKGSVLADEIYESNSRHKSWSRQQIVNRLGDGATVVVWGIAYKAETDTLRRSATQETVAALFRDGYCVRAIDGRVEMLDGADALIIGNEHPSYREVSADDMVRLMRRPLVIDPSGWLNITDPRIEYVVVGRRSTMPADLRYGSPITATIKDWEDRHGKA